MVSVVVPEAVDHQMGAVAHAAGVDHPRRTAARGEGAVGCHPATVDRGQPFTFNVPSMSVSSNEPLRNSPSVVMKS